MNHLRNLHPGNIRQVERKQQQIARYDHGDTGAQGKPENQLFAGIEAPGGCMLRFDEAAALLHPIDVDASRNIVLDPKSNDQDQTDDEREADEIMHILRGLREVAERLGPDDRQQHELPESDIQPRQTEKDERHRRQPMREALEPSESAYLSTGTPGRNTDPHDDEIGKRQ